MWQNSEIEHFLKLTLAVYRVTELFPDDDELKQKIRNLAEEILVGLLALQKPRQSILPAIAGIFDCFKRAEEEKWVDARNFLVLQREYDKIQTALHQEAPIPSPKLTKERHKKIVDILKDKDIIKVGDLRQIFPAISRRTLIRDLEELFRGGILVRTGSGRGVHYSHKL